MAYRKASDNLFIEGAIQKVAEIGIENTRTKEVADYAGFSEATMYRRFPTKENLLAETFYYIDKQISDILTESNYIRNPGGTSFETAIYEIWHKVFRYLIDNKEKTIFLIRYRYSSLYTDEIRRKRQAYNGRFGPAYKIFEKHFGNSDKSSASFLINYIFEMTLCFAERIASGKLEDDRATEQAIWLAISSAVNAWTCTKGGTT